LRRKSTWGGRINREGGEERAVDCRVSRLEAEKNPSGCRKKRRSIHQPGPPGRKQEMTRKPQSQRAKGEGQEGLKEGPRKTGAYERLQPERRGPLMF